MTPFTYERVWNLILTNDESTLQAERSDYNLTNTQIEEVRQSVQLYRLAREQLDGIINQEITGKEEYAELLTKIQSIYDNHFSTTTVLPRPVIEQIIIPIWKLRH